MRSRAPHDLHGNVPDEGRLCLLIVDMINPFTFPEADDMLPAATEAAKRVAALKAQAKAAGAHTIYVNDNFGKWQSDFRRLLERCLTESCRGKAIAELLHPEEEDYFVLKPKHSGFYATPLELLLRHLAAQHLIITGIAGNSCVLYTASDAYMREFDLSVPADCTVSVSPADNQAALQHMERMLKADIRPSTQLSWRTTEGVRAARSSPSSA